MHTALHYLLQKPEVKIQSLVELDIVNVTPGGAEQWNFNTPPGQYYSTPECRAFQTISGELWKARCWVIYRVRLASALASLGSRDIHILTAGEEAHHAACRQTAFKEFKWVQTQFLHIFKERPPRQRWLLHYKTWLVQT